MMKKFWDWFTADSRRWVTTLCFVGYWLILQVVGILMTWKETG